MREILCYHVQGETLVVNETPTLRAPMLFPLAADTLDFATRGKPAPSPSISDPVGIVLIRRDVIVFSDAQFGDLPFRSSSYARLQQFSNFLVVNIT